MNDKTLTLLDKFTSRRESDPLTSQQSDQETVDDLGCYGWLRGIRDRAVSLELRKKTGAILAVNYSFIDHFEFDPDTGITLRSAGRIIRITGSNLNTDSSFGTKLFEGLARHRVPWLLEMDEQMKIRIESNRTFIQTVEW